MRSKNIGLTGVLLAFAVWVLMLGPAFADDPQPGILLTHADNVPVGAQIEIVASVLDSELAPLEGVEVQFTSDVEFQNTFDTVSIGLATTDEAGQARITYAPRSEGSVALAARTTDPASGDSLQGATSLTVLAGEHQYHPEALVHDLRGRWDWFIQWGWLVVMPAAAFAIFLFVMYVLWGIRKDTVATNGADRTFGMRSSWLVPVAGTFFILGAALVLILGITLRPWASVDTGWRTQLNLSHDMPEDYRRTTLAGIGDEPLLGSWHPATDDASLNGDDGLRQYVGQGCSSCHGLDLTGGAVGDDLTESSASDLRKALKNGEEGMPAYTHLSDDELRSLTLLITGKEPPVQAIVQPTAEPTSAPTVSAPEPGPTTTPVAVQQPGAGATTPVAEDTPTPTPEPVDEGPVIFDAASATIVVDGDISDWSEIPVTTVNMQQIIRLPGSDMGDIATVDIGIRIALDSERVYLLMEVPDDYDYVADDSGLSASMAVMFRIDDPAAPHMGTTEEDQKRSLGKVDIWHWELNCGPGELSGGVTGSAGGNDPQCNLDDEYAETPDDLEDDDSTQAENTLAGVWEHTSRGQGAGSDGVWIFEMSRPLQTGDPDDAQFEAGGTAAMALAYWDPDESPDGWTSEGHIQSSTGGWIEITFP